MFLRVCLLLSMAVLYAPSAAQAMAVSSEALDKAALIKEGQGTQKTIPDYTIAENERSGDSRQGRGLFHGNLQRHLEGKRDEILSRIIEMKHQDKKDRLYQAIVRLHRDCSACDPTPIDPPSNVPLPAALPLFGCALLGLWGVRKAKT